ncbi:DUF3892 domain-containing protein [Paenibacillus chibensis]|uniref:DUF3892 domain-containing protein n=1 Tax=Paenibacillus chibensis TaxID=59846 RepID=UPI000FDB1A65|nr:DUF3892 domain-containing protein [Paenibacillus chibensis]MEC0371124.1 DUF3892 domain-containing protein [Paenibacillus chibensis]
MADRHQITCVNKSERYNPHERITHVGGKNADGTRWRITQQDAIQGIENGKWAFYVSAGGRTVDVIVAKSQYGHKYLKTVADGSQPDNLLSLSECPL